MRAPERVFTPLSDCSATCCCSAVLAATMMAQAKPGATASASVSGQVSILERAGETTEDLGNVVVFLEPAVAPARAQKLTLTNTVMALQSRQFSPRVRVVTEGSK